jgi:hypothetical protein
MNQTFWRVIKKGFQSNLSLAAAFPGCFLQHDDYNIMTPYAYFLRNDHSNNPTGAKLFLTLTFMQ